MHFSTRLAQGPYVCANCTRRLLTLSNRRSIAIDIEGHRRGISTAPTAPKRFPHLRLATTPLAKTWIAHPSYFRNGYSTSAPSNNFRVAIIGSGPAGFYTAHRLLHKIQYAEVDMYEQLPVPYGLVRFGVAPDHPDVKNVQHTFEKVADSPRFHYWGNVRVGHDIGLARMKPHYDAILFSYGASEDRKLGIPGENLPGVYSAREFVGWYNGLPQFQNLEPNLQTGDQAIVIGQGNVALDVARILLTPVDVLRKTDITEQAIETLKRNTIKHVKVVGRRGPLQASFTVKEARELMNIPDVAFHPIDRSLFPENIKKLPRVPKRKTDVLLKGTLTSPSSTPKSWTLSFFEAPQKMHGDNHLSAITFANQSLSSPDPTDPRASVSPTGDSTTYDTSLAFRSVGYKSAALPGLSDLGVPFDSKLGIIPNDAYGRVMSPSHGPGGLTAGHVPGLYCAGWVKRGPTGVIASTMDDAFMSADVIVEDWDSKVPFLNTERGEQKSTGLGFAGVKEEILAKGVRPLGWEDWKRIDEAERKRGLELGKEREKFGSVEEMLGVLDA
ncbi:NADPH:adrenodoxin oxidoreductase mitochondrial precursor [Dendryphion nanum]|uniref:NADPH:adrenodoxin oxidoreductase, mitochondrial n=1 Tax=Dendryphion nanum TaxID=256645 RepID=A0A9P9E0L7_9PLEO|nr:NADPH:adrenodoxin oxidoreductase mitochondrial precursor [Dendryphion nanum]